MGFADGVYPGQRANDNLGPLVIGSIAILVWLVAVTWKIFFSFLGVP